MPRLKQIIAVTGGAVVVWLLVIYGLQNGGKSEDEDKSIPRLHPDVKDVRNNRQPASIERTSDVPYSRESTSAKNFSWFSERYAGLLKTQEGKELHEQTLVLIYSASEDLSLEDFERFTEIIKDIEASRRSMSLLGSRYAKENYEKGLDWLTTLVDDSSAIDAFTGFGRATETGDVPQLINFALKLSNKAAGASILRGIFASGDKESTIKVIEATNGTWLQSSSTELASAPAAFLLDRRYDDALEVASHIEGEALRKAALRNILIRMTSDSPTQAARTYMNLPNESDRVGVVDVLLTRWTRSDPAAASEWASGLPKGPELDAASSAIARVMLNVNQVDAMMWAAAISQGELREREVARIIEYAKRHDLSQITQLMEMAEIDPK